MIGANIDDPYIEALKSQVIHWDSIREVSKDLKIVYTPLHGTGNIPARRVLKELGFEHVYVVKEQELPDGDFPTVSYPNPEAEEAFRTGTETCKRSRCRPSSGNRSGCRPSRCACQRQRSGVYHTLTGNMSGCLLEEYELSQRTGSKRQPSGRRSSSQARSLLQTWQDAIARSYGLQVSSKS